MLKYFKWLGTSNSIVQFHFVFVAYFFFSITTDALILKSNWRQHFKFIQMFFITISLCVCVCVCFFSFWYSNADAAVCSSFKSEFQLHLDYLFTKFPPKTPLVLNITTCSTSIKTQLFSILSFLFEREWERRNKNEKRIISLFRIH